MSNIAEGFSRRSTKEFGQFLFIGKGSVAEVQSQLCVALDLGYIKKDKPQALKELRQPNELK
jgi:four helix bundle protein